MVHENVAQIMKQVNLKEFNITELNFMFWVSLADDLLEKIRSVVAPDKDGDYVFIDSYKVDNVGHVAGAVVTKSTGELRYMIQGMCEVRRGGRLRKGAVSVSRLFEIISPLEEKTLVVSRLKLSFGRRQKYKTIISLPIKITNMPKMPYDEIGGIRFVKREGNSVKYEVILDLEQNGALNETIIYNELRNIRESMIVDIIQHGIEVSDSFILREKR